MPAVIDTVLFDFDGTLVDTAPDLAAALNRLLIESDKPPLPVAQLRPHVSAGARGLIGAGFGITSADPGFHQLRERFLACYEEALCRESVPFDGVPALLRRIDDIGIRWGIVTNKPQRYALPLIEMLNLRHRTGCIVCGDTATRAKPLPHPLQMACAILGSDVQTTVYVGDDLRDVQSGRAAGLRTVAAAWGYLGVEHPVDSWGAHWIANTPADVLAI